MDNRTLAINIYENLKKNGADIGDISIVIIELVLDRAGGIASYYTSPLALRDEYKLETGNTAIIELSSGTPLNPDAIANVKYAYWLESKLVRKAGE